MTLKTDIQKLRFWSNGFSYKDDGDMLERQSGHLITDLFKNSESFWKFFILPITNRVDANFTKEEDKIRSRDSISSDIVDLSTINYSVFLNLVYAHSCLETKHISYFENFYTHLCSACDLAEELITHLYLITLECEEKETEILQRLTKNKFLKLAIDWYEKNYSNTYTHYLSKGKTIPIRIIGRKNIIKEYFGDLSEWKDYSNLAKQIRTYRNVIVHNTQIGGFKTPKGIFVPKKNKIGEYKKWQQIFNVNPDKFLDDFVERDCQMQQDLVDLKLALNNLWSKPIQHFDKLLYSDKNQILLKKYDIEII